MLEKNVTVPAKSGTRFFLTVLAFVGALMVAATVGQALMLDTVYPPPQVEVTVTVTPPPAVVPVLIVPMAVPVIPSSYEECMDRAIHHDELRPTRCCRPDETCTVLEPTTIVDFDH